MGSCRAGWDGFLGSVIQQRFNRHMELRNIINQVFPANPHIKNDKIVHQLNNQGCRCHLCQKIVISQNQLIRHPPPRDVQPEEPRLKESFWLPFLLDFASLDRLPRKVRFLIPEVCIFEKGAPTTLISKKKESVGMRVVRHKEKLNAFEIQNFFTDGFISHNEVKGQREGRFRSMSREQYYNYWDLLKNECIVLAKFSNGSCQMLNMVELTNLFKSKQRQTRRQLSALVTLVNAQDHNQIRVPLQIISHLHSPMLERAKTEVKIINEEIKPKDFMYVSEKEEKLYEDHLRQKNISVYLQYIAMKMILLYSLKSDVLIKSALFKFIKGEGGSFYLTDIQPYSKESAASIWGELRTSQPVKQRTVTSPGKPKVRPSSSPQKLQKFERKEGLAEKGREDRSGSLLLSKENQRIKALLDGSRGRAKTGFKLQPVKGRRGETRR